MSADLLESLPLVQRLALSYAPPRAREPTLTLLALDARLATILRTRSEPLIAQLKLAWWRDRLGEQRTSWPGGEPLLARLAEWRGDPRLLLPLVDGWEALLAEELDKRRMREFADGRAAAWCALAGEFEGAVSPEVERAGRGWALADLALNLRAGHEGKLVRETALAQDRAAPHLSKNLRPLAVLHALARRAVQRGSGEMLDGPRAAMLALRVGLAGR